MEPLLATWMSQSGHDAANDNEPVQLDLFDLPYSRTHGGLVAPVSFIPLSTMTWSAVGENGTKETIWQSNDNTPANYQGNSITRVR